MGHVWAPVVLEVYPTLANFSRLAKENTASTPAAHKLNGCPYMYLFIYYSRNVDI